MLKEYLTTIANKLRTILGTTEKINAQNFVDKIQDVYSKGQSYGYDIGYMTGAQAAYPQGKQDGYEQGITEGIEQGKQEGQLSVWNASESLQGNVSGVAISVNDVSPIKHNVGCTVGSKNLFNISNYRIMETSIGFDISALEIGKTYVFSSKKAISQFKISTATSGHNSVNKSDGYGFTEFVFTMARNSNITTDKTQYLFFKVNNNWINSVDELADFDMQIEQSATKTEYTPYITDFSGVEVSRYGKNLFDVPSMFTFKGVLDYKNVSFLKAGVTYVFYYDAATFDTESEGIVVNVVDGGSVFLKPQKAWRVTPKIDNPRMIVYSNGFDWNQSQGTIATITNFRICIADANYLEYESYIKPTVYTANADGTVDSITSISPNMTLLSNNGAVSINAKYYKDPDIVISNLQQAVALTGGE